MKMKKEKPACVLRNAEEQNDEVKQVVDLLLSLIAKTAVVQ